MNEEEFEDYVGESFKEILSKRERTGETPQEEMKEYMESRGYSVTLSKIDLTPDEDDGTSKEKSRIYEVYFAKKGNSDFSVNLPQAYVLEKERERLEIDNKALKIIYCNKCGNSMMRDYCKDSSPEEGDAYGLVGAKVNGGYLSDPLDDITSYEFNLCENCLYEMFLGFKIPPKIGCYM